MTISDIKDRRPVLEAIDEFDRLGRETFLRRYEYRPSRSYRLLHNEREYDSKPIIGVARGYARPDLGPMKATDFSGGDATVRRKLEELGFTVIFDGEDRTDRNAFLLTWKADGWDHSNILRMLESFRKQGYADEPWRIQSHRKANPGDRVWVLKQGPGPKVIFGRGEILEKATLSEAGNGQLRMMAPVRFSEFVDPLETALFDEITTRGVIGADKIRAQASGNSLSPEEADALEQLFAARFFAAPCLGADEGDDAPFDPSNLQDARDRILRSIAQRRGQSEFRRALIVAYGGRCAITGCDVLDVLEAAHIYPYRGPATNRVSNGLLLRADIHTLFDCGLIQIEPGTLTISVASSLQASSYGDLHGQRLSLPLMASQAPNEDAVRLRWTKAS